jgi:hypothetical protein
LTNTKKCVILIVFGERYMGVVTTLTIDIINDKMIPKGFKLLDPEYTNNRYDGIYLEEKLKEKHKEFKYRPKIKFGGYKECFTKLLL